MAAQTFAEKVLSAKSGKRCSAGDIVVCEADLVLGTDGSTPMAIKLFEEMGGRNVLTPERVLLARDHYAPPNSDSTRGFHARMETFASDQGLELLSVGDGISFQVALEGGMVQPGDLVIGADSHTTTCGAVGAFATGVGSTDLAALFLTGKVWLRVPETIRVVLEGSLPPCVGVKDIAHHVLRSLGDDGASYAALEFLGSTADAMPVDGRMVICNMSAETGAKIGVFPTPEMCSDNTARFSAELRVECSELEPLVALPHSPANAVQVTDVLGEKVNWVFLGTCSGGFADDFRDAVRALESLGGIADGVTLVVATPTQRVRAALEEDGTMGRLRALGATISETGCGPCCGTSAPIPPPNARIISTANRNFQGRMGDGSATIHLASPVTCSAAAAAGKVIDPREFL